MRLPDNIERHPHYPGRYIGYADGPWTITRGHNYPNGYKWRADANHNCKHFGKVVRGDTLVSIGHNLAMTSLAERIAAHDAAHPYELT